MKMTDDKEVTKKEIDKAVRSNDMAAVLDEIRKRKKEE